MTPSSKTARAVLLSSVLVYLATRPVEAAELKKETAAAFDRYIGASEGRIRSELHNELFLFIDELPETRRVESGAYRGMLVFDSMGRSPRWRLATNLILPCSAFTTM